MIPKITDVNNLIKENTSVHPKLLHLFDRCGHHSTRKIEAGCQLKESKLRILEP